MISLMIELAVKIIPLIIVGFATGCICLKIGWNQGWKGATELIYGLLDTIKADKDIACIVRSRADDIRREKEKRRRKD